MIRNCIFFWFVVLLLNVSNNNAMSKILPSNHREWDLQSTRTKIKEHKRTHNGTLSGDFRKWKKYSQHIKQNRIVHTLSVKRHLFLFHFHSFSFYLEIVLFCLYVRDVLLGKSEKPCSKHCLMIHRTKLLNNSIKMLSSSIYIVIHIIFPSF